MQKWEKIFFFYSLTGITIFIISFGIFLPRPINLVTGILMLPIVLYFWIRVTNPEKTNPTYWSYRFIFILFALIFLGIGAYYLALRNPAPISKSTNKTESVINATAVPVITPGNTTTDLIIPKVKLIGNKSVDIHETSNDASKVVGTMLPGQAYLYTDKQSGWYKIMLGSSTFGWVDGTLVEVVN